MLSTLPDGQRVSNTVHIVNGGSGIPPDFAELSLLATQWATEFSTVYKALLKSDSTFDSVIARSVVQPGTVDVYQEASATVAQAGTLTGTGDAMPMSLCNVVGLQTPNASRRYRGHLMLPPVRDSANCNGNLLKASCTYRTNRDAFITELRKGEVGGAGYTGSSLSHYELCVFSKAGSLAGTGEFSLVSGVVGRERLSWLRSRERGTT